MGKSRIIASIVTIFLKSFKKGVNTVYVAFASEILRETDKAVYADLQTSLCVDVVLTIGIDEAMSSMTKNDLLILDEADWHLLDERKDLPRDSYGVIRMTATDFSRAGAHEAARMNQLRMPVFNSKIASNIDVS